MKRRGFILGLLAAPVAAKASPLPTIPVETATVEFKPFRPDELISMEYVALSHKLPRLSRVMHIVSMS